MLNTRPTETILETGEYVFSVSELNQSVKQYLEQHFDRIWILGEISNLSTPRSGHIYFTLKDQRAQIRCAFFRRQQRWLNSQLEDGMMVLVSARPSLYTERGDYQLLIDQVQLHGEGQLQQQYERLKQKLQQQGLFDRQHKHSLPKLPKHLGIITSPTGAAIQDVISVLKRRFPLLPITIYASSVQGEQASAQLIAAIKYANQHKHCDVLLLTRGGGAMEDLWPFNDEQLAYCIFNSDIPIISAVGHEIDFTIADFVADHRAPTPSAGAELLSPDQDELKQQLDHILYRMRDALDKKLQHNQHLLKDRQNRLIHPKALIQQQKQQVTFAKQQLIQAMQYYLANKAYEMNTRRNTLMAFPWQKIQAHHKQVLQQTTQRLQHNMQQQLHMKNQKLTQISQQLHDISPLNTLKRGYAILEEAQQNTLISSVKQIKSQHEIKITLQDGEFSAICQ